MNRSLANLTLFAIVAITVLGYFAIQGEVASKHNGCISSVLSGTACLTNGGSATTAHLGLGFGERNASAPAIATAFIGFFLLAGLIARGIPVMRDFLHYLALHERRDPALAL